ncbi:hypothetical protein [Actinokineospora sp. NBRC 105648]|uniref:hypothetical protein n=1 Tax=Actinokineospora sp. NBRC 105648 TaxID=3032206 RepID=UPI002553F083|nr:hypothetical protein [Actinokineospora sp. NBRC 105648]
MVRSILRSAAALALLAVPATAATPTATAATPVTGVLLDVTAAPVDDAVARLRDRAVWLDPAAGRQLDVAAVEAAIGDRPIKIAVLPAGPGVGEVSALPRRLAADLPGQTIAVVAGRYFYAGSQVLCAGAAGLAASGAIAANKSTLDTGGNSDLTRALTDFVSAVKAAPTCAAATARDQDDTANVLPWVALGLGAGVLAGAAWVGLSRRRAKASARATRDEARELVERLGRETDDPARYAEAEALLRGATTNAQFAAARQAASAGLPTPTDAS